MSENATTSGRYVVIVSGEPCPGRPGIKWMHRRVRFTSRSRARCFARDRNRQGFPAVVRRHRRGLPTGWIIATSYVGVSLRVRDPAIGLDEEIGATATRTRVREIP